MSNLNSEPSKEGAEQEAKTPENEQQMKASYRVGLFLSSLLIVLCLFLGLLCFLVFKILYKNSPQVVPEASAPVQAHKTSEGADALPEEKAQPKFYIIDPPFVVNLQSNDKETKFLQVKVVVMTTQEKGVELIKNNLPLIQNNLSFLFSSKSYEELLSTKGKENLRKESLDIVKNTLGRDSSEQIESVLFESFFMQ